MSVKNYDSKMKCPKCGFFPGFGEKQKWQLEFKDSCYLQSCSWKDTDVKEHLHVKCPDCGYTYSAPTMDYDDKKGNQWSTEGNQTTTLTEEEADKPVYTNNLFPVAVPGVSTAAQPRVISGARAPLPSAITAGFKPKSAWETECPGCPCAAEKK